MSDKEEKPVKDYGIQDPSFLTHSIMNKERAEGLGEGFFEGLQQNKIPFSEITIPLPNYPGNQTIMNKERAEGLGEGFFEALNEGDLKKFPLILPPFSPDSFPSDPVEYTVADKSEIPKMTVNYEELKEAAEKIREMSLPDEDYEELQRSEEFREKWIQRWANSVSGQGIERGKPWLEGPLSISFNEHKKWMEGGIVESPDPERLRLDNWLNLRNSPTWLYQCFLCGFIYHYHIQELQGLDNFCSNCRIGLLKSIPQTYQNNENRTSDNPKISIPKVNPISKDFQEYMEHASKMLSQRLGLPKEYLGMPIPNFVANVDKND